MRCLHAVWARNITLHCPAIIPGPCLDPLRDACFAEGNGIKKLGFSRQPLCLLYNKNISLNLQKKKKEFLLVRIIS